MSHFQPSPYQSAVFEFVTTGRGDGVVEAVAGSGKSTTLVQAAKLLTTDSALFVAFNKSIAEELGKKLYGSTMIAKTIHSLGYGVLSKHLNGKVRMEERKYKQIIESSANSIVAAMYASGVPQADMPQITEINTTLKQLVNFCRLTLTEPSDMRAVQVMIDHFGIDVDENVYPFLRRELPRMLDEGDRLARQLKIIDFTDMIYLPVMWNLAMPTFQWISVDECQDLNACQLELLLRCRARGGRMLFVGDRCQSIYGFAGADSDSFDKIIQRTQATILPLSICYRCPASHIELAQKLVPQIEARPNAPQGILEHAKEDDLPKLVREGDLILCRLTAPLISMCIRLIGQRIPARVRGRDFAKQLTDIVQQLAKVEGFQFEDFHTYINAYEHGQVEKLQRRDASEALIQSVQDRCDGLRVCYDQFDAKNADELCREIDGLFSDGRASVMLSTVHRAKGLENERVFILNPDKLPLRWSGQQDWETCQELNLQYVAYTRAKDTLVILDVKNEPIPTPQLVLTDVLEESNVLVAV